MKLYLSFLKIVQAQGALFLFFNGIAVKKTRDLFIKIHKKWSNKDGISDAIIISATISQMKAQMRLIREAVSPEICFMDIYEVLCRL